MTNQQIDDALDLTEIAIEQEESFAANGKYLKKMPYQSSFDPNCIIEITIYDGPCGKGYVVILSANNQMKCINFGEEIYRNCLWSEAE